MHRRRLEIAQPCDNDWNAMKGSRSVRHCSSCAKNVYNISMLTEREASAALDVRPSNVCIRYHVDDKGDVVFYPEDPQARGHTRRQRAIAAIALSAMSACTEPSTSVAPAPVTAVLAPVQPPGPTASPVMPAIAPAAPEPAPVVDHVHDADCVSKWDSRFRHQRSDKHLRQYDEDPLVGMVGPEPPVKERPQPSDVWEALETARALALAHCRGNERTALVKIQVDNSGRVAHTEATVRGPGTALCIEQTVRAHVRFAPFRAASFTFKAPFKLRLR